MIAWAVTAFCGGLVGWQAHAALMARKLRTRDCLHIEDL